jgi:hypothetical protein
VEHILKHGKNLLSIVSLQNDSDRAHTNSVGTHTIYPQPISERSIFTGVTAHTSHVMAAPDGGAAAAAPEGGALAGPSAPTSTATRWALVTP